MCSVVNPPSAMLSVPRLTRLSSTDTATCSREMDKELVSTDDDCDNDTDGDKGFMCNNFTLAEEHSMRRRESM